MTEEKKNTPTPVVLSSQMTSVYANFCRASMTPEEILLDFGLNPNSYGRILDEPVEVKNRVVLSFPAAKRLLYLLNGVIQRHEQTFGEITTDVAQKMRTAPATDAQSGG